MTWTDSQGCNGTRCWLMESCVQEIGERWGVTVKPSVFLPLPLATNARIRTEIGNHNFTLLTLVLVLVSLLSWRKLLLLWDLGSLLIIWIFIQRRNGGYWFFKLVCTTQFCKQLFLVCVSLWLQPAARRLKGQGSIGEITLGYKYIDSRLIYSTEQAYIWLRHLEMD